MLSMLAELITDKRRKKNGN